MAKCFPSQSANSPHGSQLIGGRTRLHPLPLRGQHIFQYSGHFSLAPKVIDGIRRALQARDSKTSGVF